jgi:tetratricopeptide (TPR) repeat protein
MGSQRFQSYLGSIPVLLALAFNFNVLQNGFGWDDEAIIPNLKTPEHWLKFFLPDLPPAHSPISAVIHFRPLVSVSYHLEHLLWDSRPFGFHFSVWIAHLINTALVFFLAERLLPSQTRLSRFSPLLAASLFAVHPIHAEAVAWIAGRNDVYCTAFMLVSLLLYLRFHQTRSRLSYGLSMLAFFLALLTKEIAVGLILLFGVYEYLSMDHSSFALWKRTAIRLVIPLAILGVYFWMRSARMQFLPGGSLSSITFSFSILLEIIRAYGFYFKLMLFPYPHNPFIAALPVSNPFLILSGLMLVTLMAGLLFALVRRQILLGAGLAWTLVLLGPAAWVTAFKLAAAPAAERYVYAPSAGFLIMTAWLVLHGLEKLPAEWTSRSRRLAITPGLILILFSVGIVSLWGWQSWNRNVVWRTPLTFWKAAVAASPGPGLPHRLLGIQYASRGRYAEAEEQFQQAIANFQKTFGPAHLAVADSLFDLANLYRNQRRFAEAEPLYRQVIMLWEKALGPDHPDVAKGFYSLAAIYDLQERFDEAEPLYRQALTLSQKALKPDDPNVIVLMEAYARLLRKMNREDDAMELEARVRMIRTHPARN